MSNKEYIWNYLLEDIGNEYGVSALMGNLYAESGLRTNNLENSKENSLGFTDETYTYAIDNHQYSKTDFMHDSAGYGLAQWTYSSRKAGLYDMWESGGYDSISNIELQCKYLLKELSTDYKGVYSTLKTANSIREASDKVLHDFENPADQSTSVEEKREQYGIDIYEELKGTYIKPDDPDNPSSSIRKRRKFKFVLFNRKRRIYG